MSPPEITVLFVCTGNAGRSQIAEELFRQIAPSHVRVCSAGVEPWNRLHPEAVALLGERGVDARGKKPRDVRMLIHQPFGLIVTIGDPARDLSPEFPGHPVRIHWDLDDPADADGTPDSEQVFRRTMAEIEARLSGLLSIIAKSSQDTSPFSPGISTYVVQPAPFEPARHLPLIARAGFSSIELNCYDDCCRFEWRSPQALRALVSAADGEGVRIQSVHAFGDYPRGRFDEDLRRKYVDTTKAFCDIAAEVGAEMVVIHALKPNKDVPEDWAETMEQMLSELAERVLPMPLILGIENLNWLVVPSEDLALVRSQSPSATGFILDTGHAQLFNACEEYLSLCGLRLCGLHLQDTDGERDRHWLPGEGIIDWKAFMAQLVETGYSGPLTIEAKGVEREEDLPGRLEDCMKSVRMLQSYLPEKIIKCVQPKHE
jgi:sugar phosphate isomerase/epimerase/protein-tyrosine-phosphatase